MAGIAIRIEAGLVGCHVGRIQVRNRVVCLPGPVGVASDATFGGGVATWSTRKRSRPPLRVVMADAAGRVPFFSIPVGGHVSGEGGDWRRMPGLGMRLGSRVAGGAFGGSGTTIELGGPWLSMAGLAVGKVFFGLQAMEVLAGRFQPHRAQ